MPYILPSAKHPALRLQGTTRLSLRLSMAHSVSKNMDLILFEVLINNTNTPMGPGLEFLIKYRRYCISDSNFKAWPLVFADTAKTSLELPDAKRPIESRHSSTLSLEEIAGSMALVFWKTIFSVDCPMHWKCCNKDILIPTQLINTSCTCIYWENL